MALKKDRGVIRVAFWIVVAITTLWVAAATLAPGFKKHAKAENVATVTTMTVVDPTTAAVGVVTRVRSSTDLHSAGLAEILVSVSATDTAQTGIVVLVPLAKFFEVGDTVELKLVRGVIQPPQFIAIRQPPTVK